MQRSDAQPDGDSLKCRFCGSTEGLTLERVPVKDTPRKSISESGSLVAVCKFCRKRVAHTAYDFFIGVYEDSIVNDS